MVPNPANPQEEILEPLSKMTKGDKKRYIADVKVMNYILQAIRNDIYNSVDASKEGESLDSVYERLTTLVNIMDRNNLRPITVAINIKFLNWLQPEWSKYVTIVRQNQSDKAISYDVLYDSLRIPQTDSTTSKANVQCYNCNEKGHYARDCQKPKVCDAKYFREQMLLAMKDEVGSHLNNKENDFMLDNAYGEESLDELTAYVMLMARLQPADETTNTVPAYDDKAASQVHASSKAHEYVIHEKRKTIIQTTDDDQIDSSIIFDDQYVDNNGGSSKHDSIAHE
ncbi:UBN2 domain-containing protein [Tanacetum coccineum]